jgi:hypothetical protein
MRDLLVVACHDHCGNVLFAGKEGRGLCLDRDRGPKGQHNWLTRNGTDRYDCRHQVVRTIDAVLRYARCREITDKRPTFSRYRGWC